MRIHQSTQSISTQVLEALTKPKITEKDKAKIIAEGFAQIEKHYLNFDNLATRSDLREIELKLINKISESNEKTIKWMIGLVIAIMIPIMIPIISLILMK